MRARFLQPLLAAVLLTLAGCASPDHDSAIDVTLANLRFAGVTVTETTMEFTVRIENARPQPLALDGGVYELYLNGTYLGKGLSGEALEIPRLSSITVPVQLHLSNLRLASRIRAIIEGQKVDYRLESTVYVTRGRRAHCRREGVLDLKDFQPSPTTR